VKRFTIERILAETIRQNGGLAPLNEQSDTKSLDSWVRVAGSKCAAWIVANHRKQLHEKGGVAFFLQGTLAKGPPLTPPWMRIGLEKLRRSEKWSVEMSMTPARRTYVLKWEQWGTFMRPSDSAAS
jgi:hypothetical protein